MCKRCKTHKDNKGFHKRTGSLLLNWHLLVPPLDFHGWRIGELHPTAAPATCTARGPSEVGKSRRRSRGSHRRAHRGGGETARQPSAVSSGPKRRWCSGDRLATRRCSASMWRSWRPRLGPADDRAASPQRWCTGRRQWRPHARRHGTRRRNGARQSEAREEVRPRGYIGAGCAPLAWRACQGRRASGEGLAREALVAGPRWALAGLGRGGAGRAGGLGPKQVDWFSFFLK
jgi:hypothetical protein